MKNSEFHKVLAYGSNLDTEDWDKFVARYAQTNVVFESLGKVLIPDYGLVFDKYAHSRKGGVANIRYNKGLLPRLFCLMLMMKQFDYFGKKKDTLIIMKKKKSMPFAKMGLS